MHIQDVQRVATSASGGPGGAAAPGGGTGHTTGSHRPAPLRVDAQRNLEHVLRAAREVFGELGYGAPMEDVARRARVGVGTVYRRFPSKDVLVRRIAEEETARLTEQARSALGQEDEAWSALARFLRTSAASGAGRLLPPQVLRVEEGAEEAESAQEVRGEVREEARGEARGEVRGETRGEVGEYGRAYSPGGPDAARVPQQRVRLPLSGEAATAERERSGREAAAGGEARGDAGDGVPELLDVVGRLVERAREAGELRRDVSVADVLLVIATAAPALPDAAQQAAASSRLLDILLDGLRSRPGA
jgi:AcrR family transcriptional regulator